MSILSSDLDIQKQQVSGILKPLASNWVKYFIRGGNGDWSGIEDRPLLVEIGGIGSGEFGWSIGGEKTCRYEDYNILVPSNIAVRDSLIQVNQDKSFYDLQNSVNEWAEDKGIFAKGTPLAQADKTLEEAQEIKDAIELGDRDAIADGIGDTLVTLIIQARMQNLDIVQCLADAYGVISKRTGQMVDGKFVKD